MKDLSDVIERAVLAPNINSDVRALAEEVGNLIGAGTASVSEFAELRVAIARAYSQHSCARAVTIYIDAVLDMTEAYTAALCKNGEAQMALQEAVRQAWIPILNTMKTEPASVEAVAEKLSWSEEETTEELGQMYRYGLLNLWQPPKPTGKQTFRLSALGRRILDFLSSTTPSKKSH